MKRTFYSSAIDFLLVVLTIPCLVSGFALRNRRNLLNTNSKRITSLNAKSSPSACVIGGGVSGLAAAITLAKESSDKKSVLLVESSKTLGGRVQSDTTKDGFVLDRGFAVFIEEYPFAKKLLNYDNLKLGKFLPGALVKIENSDLLARVADPLRQPQDIFTALLAPVGSLFDKMAVLPLIFNVRTKSIEELFEEPETDTLTALKERWGFSDDMIEKFFKPFLEGIYLAPLEEQSSRMFSFVFKMFSEGAASLPATGMGAVAEELTNEAIAAGVEIRTSVPITTIVKKKGGGYLLKSKAGDIEVPTVVVATEGPTAKKLLSSIDGLDHLVEEELEQTQRSVGCLYYSFKGEEPIRDPILILNGIGVERGNERNPANNACFPTVAGRDYAPPGYGLCSVTVLKDTMALFDGRQDDLDKAVREQLATWFPDYSEKIVNEWKLERAYYIPNAQPAQLNGPLPANINRGRSSSSYLGTDLPPGLFVCGDHVATATLNGALESGVNAGTAVIRT